MSATGCHQWRGCCSEFPIVTSLYTCTQCMRFCCWQLHEVLVGGGGGGGDWKISPFLELPPPYPRIVLGPCRKGCTNVYSNIICKTMFLLYFFFQNVLNKCSISCPRALESCPRALESCLRTLGSCSVHFYRKNVCKGGLLSSELITKLPWRLAHTVLVTTECPLVAPSTLSLWLLHVHWWRLTHCPCDYCMSTGGD